MNILLTARDSFVSKTILKHLGGKYNIDSFTKEELDLRDVDKLEKVLDSKDYSWVINPAIAGKGRLLVEDSHEEFYQNALITENLLFLKERGKINNLVMFSSGAGNNRNKDICNLKEGEFLEPPLSKYSLCKYLMHRRIFNTPGILNFRIFNLFGPEERNDRFIKSSVNKYINHQEIEIWSDKMFDFFGENDFITVLDYFIKNPPPSYYELNLCYPQKYLLSEICNKIINKLDNYEIPVKILENGINKEYWGNADKLQSLNLPLIGLEKSIYKIYEELKNEQTNIKK